MDSTFPLVTVGIPTYNRPKGLRRTLGCISGQTYGNLEIIVSDNASPSTEVEKVVQEFASADKRIVFVRQPENAGQKFNFLSVLEKARGEYFMWAADDDWWAPEFVEAIMARLSNDPAAVAGFSNFEEITEAGTKAEGYPDHLPLLQAFTIQDKVSRVRNFIKQYEGLGKANLLYSIFKSDFIRSSQSHEILNSGYMPADLWLGLTIMLKGPLVLAPGVLRKCMVGNTKDYVVAKDQSLVIDLLLVRVHWGKLKRLYVKWSPCLYGYLEIVFKADLSWREKICLLPAILGRILFFYYDLLCTALQLRGCNIFHCLRRARVLE